MNLPKQWLSTNLQESGELKIELVLEVIPGHLIYDKEVEVVARHEWTDDILCKHLDNRDLFTVVHLTLRGGPEINDEYPSVEFHGSFSDFLKHENAIAISLQENDN